MKTTLEDPHISMKRWEDSIYAHCNWDGITSNNSTSVVTKIILEIIFFNGPRITFVYSNHFQEITLKLHMQFCQANISMNLYTYFLIMLDVSGKII